MLLFEEKLIEWKDHLPPFLRTLEPNTFEDLQWHKSRSVLYCHLNYGYFLLHSRVWLHHQTRSVYSRVKAFAVAMENIHRLADLINEPCFHNRMLLYHCTLESEGFLWAILHWDPLASGVESLLEGCSRTGRISERLSQRLAANRWRDYSELCRESQRCSEEWSKRVKNRPALCNMFKNIQFEVRHLGFVHRSRK